MFSAERANDLDDVEVALGVGEPRSWREHDLDHASRRIAGDKDSAVPNPFRLSCFRIDGELPVGAERGEFGEQPNIVERLLGSFQVHDLVLQLAPVMEGIRLPWQKSRSVLPMDPSGDDFVNRNCRHVSLLSQGRVGQVEKGQCADGKYPIGNFESQDIEQSESLVRNGGACPMMSVCGQ